MLSARYGRNIRSDSTLCFIHPTFVYRGTTTCDVCIHTYVWACDDPTEDIQSNHILKKEDVQRDTLVVKCALYLLRTIANSFKSMQSARVSRIVPFYSLPILSFPLSTYDWRESSGRSLMYVHTYCSSAVRWYMYSYILTEASAS